MYKHLSDAAQQPPVLLPTLIDQLAAKEPLTLWGEYPVSTDTFELGFAPITYANFANAVNGVSHHLRRSLSDAPHGETLAYLAPNDARCTISLIAAMRAGFNLFLISERNTIAVNINLLEGLECTNIVTTDPNMAAVRALRAKKDLNLIVLPGLETLLHEPQEMFPYARKYTEAMNETAFIVHTSGSTGLPKIMSISHCYIARAANNICLNAPEGYSSISKLTGNNRTILLLPLNHPAGVHFGMLNPFFNRCTVILPKPNIPPTAETLLEMLKHVEADWATLAPLTLEGLSKNASLLDEIAPRLRMVLFSGGSLPKVFGDVLATRIQLTSLLGSSESGPIPTIYHHNFDFRTNWNYLCIHPAMNATFDSLPGDVSELVFHRSAESEPHQTVFTLYPGLSSFRTRDLFTQHPMLPDLWTHASRSDDVIVFLNGEKLNPVTFESHVSQHPDVSGVIMFGAQRFESGLLIDLGKKTPSSASGIAQAISTLWPVIEHANTLVPGYAKVSQSLLCFTEANRPILRSQKGTIRRNETLELYKSEIQNVYLEADRRWTPLSQPRDDLTSERVQCLVHSTLRKVLEAQEVNDTDDFFKLGVDSLQALRLAQSLRIGTGVQDIQSTMIYSHPTVSQLSQAILETVSKTKEDTFRLEQSRSRTVEATLAKFTQRIDELKSTVQKSPGRDKQGNQVVLVTGSTGFVGSYLLDALMVEPSISHVYCINRSADSADIQVERNTRNDPYLATSFAKVTFLTGDLQDINFLGVSPSVYQELQETLTLIIHNAWPVNFNLPLSAFEPILNSVVALVALGAQSTRRPSILLVSSISTTFNFQHNEVPEEIVKTSSAPAASGYAESKHIAERLMDYAAHNLSLGLCSVLRLGQITGPKHSPGRWNDSDWVPALVRSSRSLGVIPSSLNIHGKDFIDWLPIDETAKIIVELGLSTDSQNEGKEVQVYHLLNPRPTSWGELLPDIIKAIDESNIVDKSRDEQKQSMKVVAPEVWLSALRESSNGGSNISLDANPALKLMGIWEQIFGRSEEEATRMWSTAKSQNASTTMANMEKILGASMRAWTKGWFETDCP